MQMFLSAQGEMLEMSVQLAYIALLLFLYSRDRLFSTFWIRYFTERNCFHVVKVIFFFKSVIYKASSVPH